MKNLLLFTAQFPFGNGETFIENELPFLVEAFEQVIIIAADTTSPQTRTLPSKVKVIRRPLSAGLKHKLASLLRFFSKDISNEIHFVKQTLRPRPYAQILSAIIGSYAQGLAITQFIKNLIASNKLEPASTLLYSYWMDNTALGLALFKKQNPDIKAICRAHGWDVYFERHQPAYLPFRNLIATQLDYCCCISENGRQYLLNKLGLAFKNKIRLARLGTINNTNHISAANTGKLVIVSCSAIIPLKRIHLIIESLALLNDINVEWVHFGAGPLEKTIKELAAQRLNTGKITYAFAGHVSNARVL
ncbi:MAG TPA: hypothetical protein VG603_02050, partial [Chitinophagales bacterium]|nr:hypothetical protein [Chitinophagales bacterium]